MKKRLISLYIALDYLVGTIAIIRQNKEAEMDLLSQIPDEEFIKA